MIALKSPRTPHLVGSGIPTSGEHKDRVDWTSLAGRFVVLEEKIDGSEVSFHFDGDANLIGRERVNSIDLNRRGGAEAHLDLFKDFLQQNTDTLFERIEDRYVVYAEWCAVVHTIYYDALPAYLIECDMQDKASGEFLSTERRRELLFGLPVVSAHVLFSGIASGSPHPSAMVSRSCYSSGNTAASFAEATKQITSSSSFVDSTGRAEGVYGKVEEDGIVTGRFKFIREDFVRMIVDGKVHWKDRPSIANKLLA